MKRSELNKLLKDFERKGGKIKKCNVAYSYDWTPYDLGNPCYRGPTYLINYKPKYWLRDDR